jgi:hypothetical protein
MSTPAVPVMPPYNQFQTFYPTGNPYTVDPAQLINNTIYESTNRINSNLNESQRFLTAEIAGVNKNIYDTIAQNGIAIERTSANGMATTERVNSQLATAIERNGASGINTTERTAGQVSSAVERSAGQVGSSVERNGGQIMAAVERVAGEGRLTTTITDAASRQASNDSARDILRAVDRIGSDAVGTTKEGFGGVLASIERNAGEGRATTLAVNGQLAQTLTDVRHSILSDVNRAASDVLNSNQQNLNVLTKHVTDGAWEQRTAMASGFQNISEEHLRTKHDLAQQASTYYASNMLEQQKSTALLSKQQDNHFAALLLEQQKSKECLTLQLQEAKYEALKNKCDLSKEMAECCCEIKMKVDQRGQDVINTVDTLDRNRLRDEVNTINNENTILKLLDYGDYGRHRHRSRSPDRRRR